MKEEQSETKSIQTLADHYFELLDISQEEAFQNAEHIFKYVTIEDEFGDTYTRDSLKPIVWIVERAYNKETKQYLDTYSEEDLDNGNIELEGAILPYLSKPENEENAIITLVTLQNSGFQNEDGSNVFARTTIVNILDMKS